MTDQVLTVAVSAGPEEVVRRLTTHDVSALAVVDEFDVVIGVLTRTDVLESLTWREEQPRRRLPWRRELPEVGWQRTTAREMMTAPAVTIGPEVTPAQAGRLMHRAGVNRLLVTDHRRHLLGIIAAADLLKIFGRSDENVRADVEAALRPVTAGAVRVGVDAGVVLLTGRVPDRPTAKVLRDLAHAAPGATDVITDLRVEPATATRGSSSRAADARHRPALDGWWTGRRHSRTTRSGVPYRPVK
jgi:CBS domain-containing protein